jgi:tRNA G18 (ribose-2'-O)-methylase SpoU
MKRIESASNETFRALKSCLESKGIKKENLFFVFGKNPIDETLKASHKKARIILATQEQSDEAHRLHRFLSPGYDTLFLAPPLFEELNVFGIDYPILVCEAPQWNVWNSKGPAVICPFQNPQNLGAALRSAIAFDMKVVLTKESAHPLHPKSTRALSGNIFLHNIETGPSINDLDPETVIVVDKDGDDISKFKFPKDAVLLIGEEGKGVPDHLQDSPRVSIPISNKQESLNAMAALSIAAFQFRTQYKL